MLTVYTDFSKKILLYFFYWLPKVTYLDIVVDFSPVEVERHFAVLFSHSSDGLVSVQTARLVRVQFIEQSSVVRLNELI